MGKSFVEDLEQIRLALEKLEAEKRPEKADENAVYVYEPSLGFIASDFDPA